MATLSAPETAAVVVTGAHLKTARRVVVKLGSALLVGADGAVRRAWLKTLAADLARLHAHAEVVVVSSGAIALGRTPIGYGARALRLEESQAAAAVGQIALAAEWTSALAGEGMRAAQVLLTLRDTEERRAYLNARSTIGELLRARVVPVINENDTIATSEIRYGDNDRLAARVATMISADCLVLLSDIDGLYTAPPKDNPDAELIPEVSHITDEIAAMAGDAGSALSRGGMKTKIDAARIATEAGTRMAIASGHVDHPLRAIEEGARATWFHPRSDPVTARKVWIAGSLLPMGALTLDDGAVAAVKRGRSLLPAGVAAVEGQFARGDAVRLVDTAGREVGRGLVAYDADDARLIAGQKTKTLRQLIGARARATMVHRDDMALFTAPPEGL
ncbi:glutamate 5-kinase [Acuticoccus mangrovi]|uniref:Glutamate 5-kinase n=1 Tax=Acuticoccus mangrovi TaxID=2796142 RepID=A0A934IMN9_9HYPH|nr:glutamate 5-kinase [Acuticoccus mangrovi]MBJ3775042.1 glutamate 5-kinase [Acuticoccus mangrovi]